MPITGRSPLASMSTPALRSGDAVQHGHLVVADEPAAASAGLPSRPRHPQAGGAGLRLDELRSRSPREPLERHLGAVHLLARDRGGVGLEVQPRRVEGAASCADRTWRRAVRRPPPGRPAARRARRRPARPAPRRRGRAAGRRRPACRPARRASGRSGRLTVPAPSSARPTSAAGLDGASITETFHTTSAGISPSAWASTRTRRRPMSATRKPRMPQSTARSTSSTA